jgi:hypothetical protein
MLSTQSEELKGQNKVLFTDPGLETAKVRKRDSRRPPLENQTKPNQNHEKKIFFFFFFETGSYYVAQAGLELAVFLPQPLQ